MSKKLISAAFTLAGLLTTTTVPSLLVAQSAAPLLGTWQLNVAKSKYSPGPPPKSSTLKWEQTQGGMKFTTDGVDAQGQANHTETLEKGDGTEAPVQGAQAPTTRAFKRIDDHTYEDADKVNGKPTLTRRLVISQDGRTLTVTMKGTNAQGQTVNNVVVYEKQ